MKSAIHRTDAMVYNFPDSLRCSSAHPFRKQQGVNNIASLQPLHAAKKSVVVCGFTPDVKPIIKSEELKDGLNIKPALSEVYDIVQKEKIEQELMDDFEEKQGE